MLCRMSYSCSHSGAYNQQGYHRIWHLACCAQGSEMKAQLHSVHLFPQPYRGSIYRVDQFPVHSVRLPCVPNHPPGP